MVFEEVAQFPTAYRNAMIAVSEVIPITQEEVQQIISSRRRWQDAQSSLEEALPGMFIQVLPLGRSTLVKILESRYSPSVHLFEVNRN